MGKFLLDPDRFFHLWKSYILKWKNMNKNYSDELNNAIGNGRTTDVIVREDELFKTLEVWADGDVVDVLYDMPGVDIVRKDDVHRCKYSVWLDPRYDKEWMIKEIEAKLRTR